jgi:cytoskeleton protein RodZ
MGVAGDACMAGVATRLRSAREHAGLTIEEIAARTKISPVALAAIERGDFDRLPGEFFARAFVRSYAQELRLPVPEVMAEYDAAARPHPPVLQHDATASQRNGGSASDELRTAPRTILPNPTTAVWSVAALAIIVAAVMLVVNRPERQGEFEPRAVGTSGTAPVVGGPVAAASVGAQPAATTAAPAPPGVPSKLTLEIRPSRRLWVTGHADGTRVLYRNIQPGERVVVEGSELSFRVGDAGAFEYTLNGVPGKPPGRSGEVREFRITRKNYREFAR